MHDCPYGRVVPKTNPAFWEAKRGSNVERDQRNISDLEAAGWQVLVVWECWTKPQMISNLPDRLADFLRS